MENINKRILIIIIVIIFLLQGCSESFLDIPQRGATVESDFYKTDSEALEGLMAVYDQLQGIQFTYFFYLQMALSDECYAGGGQRGDYGSVIEEINEFRFGPSNSGIRNNFSWIYTGIFRTNKVIDNVTPDTENKKIYIAIARVIRAFHYFNLVTSWGDVPLVLHELPPENYSQSRVSSGLIWEQIEKDLNEAIPDLPVKSEMPDLIKNLVSKGTAQALLGKVLLFQKKYDEAAYQFDLVINSNEYDLYPDYSKILRPESEYGVESLFEVAYTTSKYYIGLPGSESSYFVLNTSPRESYFEGGRLGIIPGWGFYNPRESLYDAFIEAGDSIRRKASVISEDELIAAGGKLRNINGNLPYASDGFVRLKYIMYDADGGLPQSSANNGTNARIIRYADVLLMAAEANNRKSLPNDTKALQYINKVRRRVKLSDLNLTGDNLFEAIKKERRLELAFESVRYMDLIRWGDAYDVLKDQGKKVPLGTGSVLYFPEAGFKTSKNELLPIPETEMNVNQKMVQNQGY
jgi:hypothetical protein